MVDRKFLGEPLDDIALEYHSQRIRLDTFAKEVAGGVMAFADNIKHLAEARPDILNESYMEEWMESFLAWFELNRKRS